MKKIHEEVLTETAKSQFAKFSLLINDDFYLAGGTALALQIGHRISLDFDLFSVDNRLLKNDREKILANLKNTKHSIRMSQDGTLHILINGISFSLFHYPYPLISPYFSKWRNIDIAGILDIATMKLSAVQGRGSKKDFIDLYFIAKKIPLIDLLQIAEKKFKTQGNFLVQTCKALTYFNDAEKELLPKMIENISWVNIKQFFIREAKRVVKALR